MVANPDLNLCTETITVRAFPTWPQRDSDCPLKTFSKEVLLKRLLTQRGEKNINMMSCFMDDLQYQVLQKAVLEAMKPNGIDHPGPWKIEYFRGDGWRIYDNDSLQTTIAKSINSIGFQNDIKIHATAKCFISKYG